MRKHAFIASLLLLAAGAALAYWITQVWSYTMDDSYITFRYARNLAAGLGPVFNESGPRAEGYTSFLWVVIMAIPHLLKMDAVLFSKVVGIAAIVGSFVVLFLFVLRTTTFLEEGQRPIFAALAVAMIASFPMTAIHAVSGMETAISTLLFAAFFYACALFMERPTKRLAIACGLLGLLLGLARPEGNLVVVVAFACMVFMAPPEVRRHLPLGIVFAYAVPITLYLLWRYAYFGLVAPLSFYVKVSGAPHGMGRVARYLFEALTVPVALGVLRMSKPSKGVIPAVVGTVVFCLFFLYPAHIMSPAYRFLYPATPIIVVFASIGLARIFVHLAREESPPAPKARLRRRYAPIIVGLVWLTAVAPLPARSEIAASRAYAGGMERAHIPLGRLLGHIGPLSAKPVLAIADAGAVPYLSGWRTIDILGLNDAHIAVTGDHSAQYLFSYHPDVVVLISTYPQVYDPPPGGWQDPCYEACEANHMQKVVVLEFARDAYYLWVYARPGTQIAQAIEGNAGSWLGVH
jgi:arabinofuranosyltransferase